MRSGVLVAMLAAAAVLWGGVADDVSGQVVLAGRVLEFASETAVPGARVDLLDARERRIAGATADSAGVFDFDKVQAGAYRLRVTAAGYRQVITPPLQVGADAPVQVVVRIAADVIPLAPLEVETRAAPVHRNTALSDFYRRAQLRMGGTFILREEIENRNALDVTDLLRSVPSLNVISSATQLINKRTGCAPAVYLDGIPVGRYDDPRSRTAFMQAFETVNFTRPVELEGIEVYAGPATVPPAFTALDSACGVVAIWTRRGPGR